MHRECKNILIVDQSPTVLSAIKQAIIQCMELDASIYLGESYTQTKELLKERKFHVSILEVTLADAPNGEVIDLLREENVPVIALASDINPATKDIILQKQIIEYIAKSNPQSLNYIVTVAKRVLKNYDSYVLVVDDSKIIRTITRKNLEKLHVNVIEADSGKKAIEILETTPYYIPLVITNNQMPEMDGMELTMELRQSYSKDRLAIIALSSADDTSIATNFLRHGANDFLQKSYTPEEFAVRININLELVDLFRQGKEIANKDFLTGLYNRRFFFESGVSILEKARRKEKAVGVAMLDIDFFKKINDTYGHDTGDIAIKEVTKILKKSLRSSDLVARFGGEEFCVLMDNISLEDMKNKFEEIRKIFEGNTIATSDVSFSYTVSIGIYYGLEESLEQMITLSDQALYEAKESGRNRVVVYEQ